MEKLFKHNDNLLISENFRLTFANFEIFKFETFLFFFLAVKILLTGVCKTSLMFLTVRNGMKISSLRLQSVFDFSESCKKFVAIRRWGWRDMRKPNDEKSAGGLFTCG
jgi:hypothetical protein